MILKYMQLKGFCGDIGINDADFYFVSFMTTDQKAIINYLKGWPNAFVSGKEIARKVGGTERYNEERGWALPILAQMCRLGMIEADQYGYFRLKQEDQKKRQKMHLAPSMLKILKTSGKAFDTFILEDETDDETPGLTYRPRPLSGTDGQNIG